MVPALVLTTMVALATSAPLGTSPAGAGQARRVISLNPPPAPGPRVDWAAVQQNTQRYQQALAHQQALQARTDFTLEAGELLRDAARRAGPAPGFWGRFGYPGEPTVAQRASLQRAATEVDEAAGLLSLGAQRARARLQAVEQSLSSKPGHEAALARLRQQQRLLEQRAASVSELAPRIGAGLETRGGGAWERLGYVFQQLFRDDAETRLDGLMAELRAWGDLREPEVLGAALTYVRGELSQAALPQGQVTAAYQSADAATGSLALEDSTAGKEVELSSEVQAQAAQLGSAKAAYEYVKNQLRLDWYAGCQKGSTETLREGRGNDVDLAGLLIALLRAQGTPARYVQGTIALPLAKVADLMGLLSAAEQGAPLSAGKRNLVLNALSSAGIAYEPVVVGGQVAQVKLQHTWVEAYLPYGDYRGIGAGKAGKQWVPLEPSITGGAKYLANPPSADALQAAGGDAAALTDAYLAAPTTLSPLEAYRARVQAGLSSGTTYAQTLRTVTQQAEALDLIPGSLPYVVQSVQGEYAFLPETSKHQLHLVAKDAQGPLLDLTLPLHQVTGHRAVFSFKAATDLDAELIDQAGGVYQAPASAVQVLLLARVDGQEKAVATRSVGLGQTFDWTLELLLPNGSKKTIDNHGLAGNLIALGVGGPKNGFVEPAQPADADLDGEAARFVYGRAVAYANAWTDAEEELAQSLGVVPVRPTANVVFVENQLAVDTVAGVPDRVAWKGLEVDADLRTLVPLELQAGRGKSLLRLSGYQGSYLESKTLTDGTQAEAVSAVTVLQTAAARGLPVLTVTQANAAALLPTLSATAEVLADVRDQVARGREVRIPQGQLAIQSWLGTGYIARAPQTEEGGYFLSGVVSGAQTVVSPGAWADPGLVASLEGPDAPSPVSDTSQIARIIMASGDLQQVPVGEVAPLALKVAVVTAGGRPVAGARVTFARSTAYASQPGIAMGRGILISALQGTDPHQVSATVHGLNSEVAATTDSRGEASVAVTPDPEIIREFNLVAGTPNPVELGLNIITAQVERSGAAPLALAQPFTLLGLSGAPSSLTLGATHEFQEPVALLIGTILPVTVLDRFGNTLSNQTVNWNQSYGATVPPDAQKGRFVAASGAASSILDPTAADQTLTFSSVSNTQGATSAQYITPAVATGVALAIQSGAAVAQYLVNSVVPQNTFTFTGYGSARHNFDGIYKQRLVEPVGFQVLRRVDLGGGATSWTALRGDESDLQQVVVQMDIRDSNNNLLGQSTASPKDTLPDLDPHKTAWQPPFPDPENVAMFWPDYKVAGPPVATMQPSPVFSGTALWNQYLIFHATVLDAQGNKQCCDDEPFIGLYSGHVGLEQVDASGNTVDMPVVPSGVANVGLRVTNPASYPVGISLTQPGSSPVVFIPPADVYPRLAGLSDEIQVPGPQRATLYFPINPSASRGRVTFQADVLDPLRASRTIPTGDDLSLMVNPESVGLSADSLTARWIMPVRNFESSLNPSTGYQPADPTEFPIAVPASLTFAVTQPGALTVRSGGLTLAEAQVTLGAGGIPTVAPLPAGQPVPEVTSDGLLKVLVPPGDPAGQDVQIELHLAGGAIQAFSAPLTTVVEDASVAPVGHTFVKDVSVADGHLMKQFEDLRLPGRGGGLEFTRSYTSRSSGTSPLGPGWTHSYRSHVVHDTSRGLDRYLVVGGEGTGQAFTCPGSNADCTPQRGFHGRLRVGVPLPDGGVGGPGDSVLLPDGGLAQPEVVYFAKNGTEYHYGFHVARESEEYLLTRVVDPVGNATTLTPGGSEVENEVTRVTEPDGRYLLFSYVPPQGVGSHLTLAQVRLFDPTDQSLGVCIHYGFTDGELTSAARFDGDCDTGQSARSESYHYVASDVAQFKDNLDSYTDPNGRVTQYTYYADSDTLPGEEGFRFFGDKRERVKTVIEPAPMGGVTTFTYGLSLGPVSTQTASLTGNAQGYTTTVQGPRPGVPETTYRMNAYGSAEEIVRPISPGVFATSSSAWDRLHMRKTAELDARGRPIHYRYDAAGNLVERRITTGQLPPSGDDTLGALGVVDAAGAPVAETVELWAYDPTYAAMTCHIDPEGRVTLNTTDHGLVRTSTRLSKTVDLSRLVAGADCIALAHTVQPDAAHDIVVQHFYCGFGGGCPAGFRPGDLEHSLDGNQNSTEVLAYDSYGNPTQTAVHPGQTIVTTSTFDGRSRLTDQSDTSGHRSHRDFDALDRLSLQVRYNDNHSAPAQTHAFTYYPGGQPMDEKVLDGTSLSAPALYTRHTDLDSLNLPHQVTETGLHLDAPLVLTTEHDQDGNATQVTDRRGVTTHTGYDFADRPTVRYVDLLNSDGQHVVGSAVGITDLFPNQIASYQYDLAGNKVAEKDLHGFVTRSELDALYRVVKTHLPEVPGTDLLGSASYVLEHRYDRVGNKTQELDGNDHPTKLEYDFANRLTATQDAANRREERDYDFNGNVHELRQLLGGPNTLHLRRVTDYDGLNRPLKVTETVQQPSDLGGQLTYVQDFDYDDTAQTRAVAARDRRGLVSVQYLDALDQPERLVADSASAKLPRLADPSSAGPALNLTSRFEYDRFGNRSASVDPLGRRTTEQHDALKRLVERDLPMGVSESFAYDGEGHAIHQVDRRGIASDAYFDVAGRPVREELTESISSAGAKLVRASHAYADPQVNGLVAVTESDANTNVTQHFLDALGREVTTIDAAPFQESSQARYDAKNKRLTVDRKGYQTKLTYDAVDRLSTQDDFDLGKDRATYHQGTSYRDDALTLTAVDRGGIQTFAELDGLGRTVRSTRSKGSDAQQTVTSYDGDGNATDVTDANGHVTHSAFDGANRKLSEDRGYGKPEHELTRYTYDAVGNQTSIAHQRISGPDVTLSYDDLNRAVRSVDALGHATTHAYDQAGNKLCELKPLGGDPLGSGGVAGQTVAQVRDTVCAASSYLTQYAYDEVGQIIEVTDALGGQYSFRYDKQRNLLAKQDANGDLTTYAYDALNRRTDEHQHLDPHPRLPLGHAAVPGAESGPDPVSGVGTLDYATSYDANGNPDFSTDPKGQHVHSSYGLLNRLATQDFLAPGALPYPATSSVSYTYRPNGVLESVTEHKLLSASASLDEVTSRTYDGLDRLLTETRTYGGPSGAAKTLTYAYDSKGNRTLVQDSDGVSTHYTFDALDRISTATLDGATQPTSYTYYPDGLLKTEAQSNGIAETRTYDDASRLVDITTKRNSSTLSRFQYAYDPNGNRQTLLETRTNPATQSLKPAESTNYGYDGLDRLTSANYPDKVSSYTLDAVGNRLHETEVDVASGNTTHDVSATFNRADWLLSRADAKDASASTSFGYDLNGNLTGKLTASLSREIAWDVRDTVSTVTDNNVTVGTYDYNWQKQRTRRDTASEHGEYVLDDKFVLQEARSDQGHTSYRRYHYAMSQLAVVDSGTLNFISTDAQGSTSDITSASGSVTKAEQYDAWGKNRNGTAPTANEPKLGYTGHQFDPETGLIYARARYYDSDLGVFLSRDPREAPIGEAPWLNRYVYVKGNPLLYIDIDGLETAEETQLHLAQQYYAKTYNYPGAYRAKSVDELKASVASFQAQKEQAKETIAYESAMSGGTEMEHVIHDVSDLTGGNKMAMAVTGETITGKGLSPWERLKNGVSGLWDAAGVATGITGVAKGAGEAALEKLVPDFGAAIDEAFVSTAEELNAGGHTFDAPSGAAPPPKRVIVDTSALLDTAPKELSGRDVPLPISKLDTQIAGRTPVIPQQVFREFVVNTTMSVEREAYIKDFVKSRGGVFEGLNNDAAAKAIQAEVEVARAAYRGPSYPKPLGPGDAQIAQVAKATNTPIISSDVNMIRALDLIDEPTVEPLK